MDFITGRAVKSISAAKTIAATWVWEEKSPAEMQAQLDGIVGNASSTPPVAGQQEIAAAAEQTMKGARGAWDDQLDVLHRWTMQGVGMAKTKYRDQPGKMVHLSGLSARGSTRPEILDEALAWESAWGRIDPAFAPLPANTWPAFQALRTLCSETLKTAYSDRQADWRDEAEKLAALGRAMEDINEAWYADATRVFPAGTPEGDMIRGTIPTTYNPPAADKPTPPPVG